MYNVCMYVCMYVCMIINHYNIGVYCLYTVVHTVFKYMEKSCQLALCTVDASVLNTLYNLAVCWLSISDNIYKMYLQIVSRTNQFKTKQKL